MRALPEYRDRDDAQVAVLDALADRREDGMTVFELRTRVDIDIDRLEDALSELKADDLIEVVEASEDRTVIKPDERAIGPVDPAAESTFDWLRERLPF